MKVRSGAHFAQCESRSVAVLPYSRSGSGELRKTAPPGRDSMIVARVPNLRLLIDFVSMDARESPNAALGYLRNQEPCARACDNRTMALRTADRDFMAYRRTTRCVFTRPRPEPDIRLREEMGDDIG